MDLKPRVLPIDRFVAIYNAALAGLWAAYVGRAPHAAWLALAHVAAAALPALLRRAPAPLSPSLRTLRELYPVIWLAGFWPELGLLQQLRIPPTFDQQIAALDLALFGIHGSHGCSNSGYRRRSTSRSRRSTSRCSASTARTSTWFGCSACPTCG